MDKITDKVYLGNFLIARDEETLLKHNINSVLSCSGPNTQKYKNENIQLKALDLNDSPNFNIIKYFKEAIEYIESSERVLVHCGAGVSRSATIVVAYLMWKNKLSFKESLKYVGEHRIINPNPGFQKQLYIFQEKLKESNYELNKIDFQNIEWPIINKNK